VENTFCETFQLYLLLQGLWTNKPLCEDNLEKLSIRIVCTNWHFILCSHRKCCRHSEISQHSGNQQQQGRRDLAYDEE